MSNHKELKLAKWPFLLGDAVLLGCAYYIYIRHTNLPLGRWEEALFLLSGGIGAALAVTPFFLEYRAAVKMIETGAIVSTIARIQNLEDIAAQIAAATAQWQMIQEHARRTTSTASEIATRMTTESAAFTEFLQKSNDSEKATLRLEVDKLRRAEGDWLQILVRMLDHTYALYQAAVRSGQPGLIEQLGQFQNSCRDVARRIGLIPFIAAANTAFDPNCHKSPEADVVPEPGALVRDTIATGYTYQGQLLRPALVVLQDGADTLLKSSEPDANGKSAKPAMAEKEQTLL